MKQHYYCTSCEEVMPFWERWLKHTVCRHCVKYPMKDGDYVLIHEDQYGSKLIQITLYYYDTFVSTTKILSKNYSRMAVFTFGSTGRLLDCDGIYVFSHHDFMGLRPETVRFCREALESINISTDWIDHGDKHEDLP